jgi:hypothetical protein
VVRIQDQTDGLYEMFRCVHNSNGARSLLHVTPGWRLAPALGHDVVNVSRGKAEPYRPHPAWDAIVSFEHSAAG